MTARAAAVVLTAVGLSLAPTAARAQEASPADALVGNAVRVEAGGHTGFGFLVGLTGEGRLLVATAWHTLEGLFDPAIEVCFHPRGQRCDRAEVVYVADAIGSEPSLDVAVLSVSYPHGHVWRPDAMAPLPEPGDEVWVIGRARQWYVPQRPGRVTGSDPATRTLGYEDLEVTEGVSGAPVVTRAGIVAMHVSSAGAEAGSRGVDARAIRDRVVEHLGAHWLLVPDASCADQEAHRRVLDGSDVVVHLDSRVPDAALEAMARLACLGARVIPELHVDAPWPGNRVEYTAGGVRRARAAQAALASLGRLETGLAEADADLAIWIR